MEGKSCVITGATSGIGRAAAIALGERGANLVLLGRNQSVGEEVVRRIRQRRGEAVFIPTDLSVLSEVRAVAGRIQQQHSTIDVLVNNAGARFDAYRISADGFELTFATNHLGHFLLTALLLEGLLQSPEGRIITVSSGSHGSAVADGKWQLPADRYDRRQAYARSKLANLVFAYELARRFKETRVVSNAVDPGGVASNFARNNGLKSWARHLLAHGLRGELVFPRRGAEGIVYLATSSNVAGVTGKYYHRKLEISSSPDSHDPRTAASLWKLSVSVTGLSEQIGTAAWSRMQP